MPTLHIRAMSQSVDVEIAEDSAEDDQYIRHLAAGHLDVAEISLANHQIDRHENGNLTIRPQAVFG